MWNDFKFRSDRNVGPVVGACIVFMLGGLCFLVVGSLAYPQDNRIPVLIALGFLFGAFSFVWLTQTGPRSTMRERFSWIGSKRHREGIGKYEPQLIRQRPVRYGTKQPPTIDEIRDLKDSPTNWVPSNAVSGRKTVKRR
jgi:hypothetical protein